MCGGRIHPWLVFSLTSFILATATGAHAQTWLSDRKRAEGSGIRVGDLEIHPGLGAEFGYITNVYNAEDGKEIDSSLLRVAPHVFLSTLTEQRLEGAPKQGRGMLKFKGGLTASINHYFADNTPATEFNTDVDLNLQIAPERPLSVQLIEHFNRRDRPFSDPASDPNSPADSPDVAPNVDYAQYTNTAGARVLGQTNGGLLSGSIGYRFGYTWYVDPAFKTNDNLAHIIDLTGAWEFLPKTALFYEAAYGYQNYTNNDPGSGTDLRLVDNHQVSSRLGLNGAITPRISGTIAGGYAVGFFGGNDFEGLTANAEGRWTPSEVSEWALGYERAYTSAYQGNFVRRDQIYTRLRFFFGGAFVIASKLAVEFLDFGPDPTQEEQRSDIRYSADLSGEYRFVDWLALTAQVSALYDDTDFVSRVMFTDEDGVRRTLEDPGEFKSFEGWIGLRAFY